MNNETWITAKEALEYGFATKTETEDECGVSQSVFGNIRETLLNPGNWRRRKLWEQRRGERSIQMRLQEK